MSEKVPCGSMDCLVSYAVEQVVEEFGAYMESLQPEAISTDFIIILDDGIWWPSKDQHVSTDNDEFLYLAKVAWEEEEIREDSWRRAEKEEGDMKRHLWGCMNGEDHNPPDGCITPKDPPDPEEEAS